MSVVIVTIQLVANGLTLLILVDIVVSFALAPWHPFRRTLDSWVSPLLAPIRRILPPVGMVDFSPVVLVILIQLAQEVLITVVRSLAS
jgi:YggT family protein